MDIRDVLERLGIAFGLGLIVGLQRERTGNPLAGIRTFPLISVFGGLAGLLAAQYGGWIVGAGLLAVVALMVIGATERHGPERIGTTTEAAMLVMYSVGAFAMQGDIGVAAIIGGMVAVLLHLKPQMHSVAQRLEDPDFKAIMQFVVITLVILPILPDKNYGPYSVLNPHKIWLMVVLIVGISVAGFMIYKFFGERVGTLMGGFLGGLISSTATTVSYARRSAGSAAASSTAALVILIASTVVFVRVLIIISAVDAVFLRVAAGPLAAMLGVMAVISLVYWRKSSREPAELPPQTNPSELKAALVFAAIYAVVLIAVAAAKKHFGNQGLYVVAIISGLTDLDAISLSVSDMVQRAQVGPQTGWRLIFAATLANMVFKTAAVAVLGSRQLLARASLLFGISLASGVAIILFWPSG